MGRAAVGRMSHRFAPGRCPKLAQRRSRDKGPANHSLMFFLAARSAIRWKPIRFHACRRISEFPTLLSRSNHHLCHSLFPCPLQIQDNAEYRQWPLSTRNPPVGDIHATNLGLFPVFPKSHQTYLLWFPRVARVCSHSKSTKISRTSTHITFLSVLIVWSGIVRGSAFGVWRWLLIVLRAALMNDDEVWSELLRMSRDSCSCLSCERATVEGTGGDKPEMGLKIIIALHFTVLRLWACEKYKFD